MSFMGWYMVIACFGTALLCLYWHCRAIWLWLSIPNWPRVEAVVRKSIIRQKSSRHRHYALDIEFGYRFRGEDYIGRQPVPGGLVTQTKQGVEAVAATMAEGTVLKVHVNPRRPREAYAAPVASRPADLCAGFRWRWYADPLQGQSRCPHSDRRHPETGTGIE